MNSIVSVVQIIFMVLAFILAILGIFLILNDGKVKKPKNFNKKVTSIKKEDKPKEQVQDKKEKKKDNEKNKNKVNYKYTQDILQFDKIEMYSEENPFGLIVRSSGTEFVGVLEVHGVNYNLLSSEEREILQESFERLINGLDFDIQLYVQSRKIDIDGYSYKYNKRLKEIKNDIDSLKNKIRAIEDSKNGLNDKLTELKTKLEMKEAQYNYGQQITNYIINRCQSKNMLRRNYYIIASYTHDNGAFSEKLTYEEILSNAFSDINNKLNSLISSLSRGNLKGDILSAFQLAELLYSSYNKPECDVYKLDNAIKSKFSHLYSTSEPIEIKAIKRNIEELKELEAKEIEELDKIKLN